MERVLRNKCKREGKKIQWVKRLLGHQLKKVSLRNTYLHLVPLIFQIYLFYIKQISITRILIFVQSLFKVWSKLRVVLAVAG